MVARTRLGLIGVGVSTPTSSAPSDSTGVLVADAAAIAGALEVVVEFAGVLAAGNAVIVGSEDLERTRFTATLVAGSSDVTAALSPVAGLSGTLSSAAAIIVGAAAPRVDLTAGLVAQAAMIDGSAIPTVDAVMRRPVVNIIVC